jgi:UDP-N-acetylmuramoylalanine--D-glutamate ligase
MNEIMTSLRNQFKNKKILLVGLGIQGGGVGVAEFFAKLGANVTVTDLKNEEQLSPSIALLKSFDISYTLGKHNVDDFLNAEMIFKGPSVRWDNPLIQAAIDKGIPVEMETSFFSSLSPAPIIGITGTRGKSTTTHLIYEMMKVNGLKVHLGGNIPGQSTIQLLETLTKDDNVVLELSSWQLSGFEKKKISPHISVFTNFYPDHLNYYKTMDDYFKDKGSIYRYQKENDFLVVSSSLKDSVSTKSQTFYFDQNDFPEKLIHLRGEHNRENASAAWKVANILKLQNELSQKAIADFPGLPSRQEMVGETEKLTFINDTTSTTPIATIKALHAFEDKPIVLILGGNDKGLPEKELIDKLTIPVSIILLKGSFTDKILPKLEKKYAEKISPVYDVLDDAVKAAYDKGRRLSKPAYILFSPGATSFAMFKNEFHRGEEYKRIVNQILS